MKIFYCLLFLIFTTSVVHSETFKIDSFYYIDNPPKPNEIGSKIVFTVDRNVSCEGNVTNKIFISKDSYKLASTTYLLIRFWPSYFLKQAALVNAEINVAFGRYEPTLDACEVGFKYEGSSTQRWYEPHEFKVSDIDDTNPINKVYYQLYINASSPTYAPWVYADTDYSVICDGVTTNRVIPTNKPNEFGQTIPSEFGSQANPNYSSENTRSFFDLLSGKLDQYTVGRYVPELDACMIYDVQFSRSNISTEAIEIGMQQCIDDPEMCNLFSREEMNLALQIGVENGKKECKESPGTCELFDQANMDESFNSGEVAGKANCIAEPDSCNLFNLEDINTTVAESITGTVNDIAALLPKGILKSICKKQAYSLLCVNADIDAGDHGHDQHHHKKSKKGHERDKHQHDKHKD